MTGRGAVAAVPALEFAGVGKTFADGTVALRDVSLTVAPAEFVTIVGPSGCGKTTLLRVASGLATQTTGVTRVQAGQVGYVFQDATLLPWRTVQGNVELLAELRKLPRAERRRRANEAIDLVGLSDFAGHRPRALSGGMRMRVSLARSLTLDPELFLFDEPFGPLDEISRERLNDELLQLFISRRFAALFVTHSITEAVYLSNRVVVMSGRPGRILAEFEVPFDYPRLPQLRFEERFSQLARRVSDCLRGDDAAAPATLPAPAPFAEGAGPA
jgi:NitT/TauT family transport system ATP-binding protein